MENRNHHGDCSSEDGKFYFQHITTVWYLMELVNNSQHMHHYLSACEMFFKEEEESEQFNISATQGIQLGNIRNGTIITTNKDLDQSNYQRQTTR